MDVDDSNDYDPDDDYVPNETETHESESLFGLQSNHHNPLQLDGWVNKKGWTMDDNEEQKEQDALAQKAAEAQAVGTAFQLVPAKRKRKKGKSAARVQNTCTAMTRISSSTQMVLADVTTIVLAEMQDMMKDFLLTQDKMQASIMQLQIQQEITNRQLGKIESEISQKRLEVNQVDLIIIAQDNPNSKLMSRRDMGTEEIARLVCQLVTTYSTPHHNTEEQTVHKFDTMYNSSNEYKKAGNGTYIYDEGPLGEEVTVRQRADIPADKNAQETKSANISSSMHEHTINCAQGTKEESKHIQLNDEQEMEHYTPVLTKRVKRRLRTTLQRPPLSVTRTDGAMRSPSD
eukprot:gene2498-4855_t